jgi:predicted nuclease with TOPRIM domain
MQQRNIEGSRLLQIIGAKEYELDILREHISRLEKEKKELQEKCDKKETKPLEQAELKEEKSSQKG